jgi:Fur family zinc uptake transcriptional regulator
MSKLNLMRRAKRFCEAGKYRFTEPRERVLSLLASYSEPMGAYQILESLSSRTEKLSPPTVYRAVEFWHEHGFIHRVESMNAYIACCEHNHHENFCIFICNECNTVVELNMQNFAPTIASDINHKHLTVTSSTTEIYGQCNKCN